MPITKTDKKKDGLQGYRVRVNYTDKDGRYARVERIAYGLSEAKELEQKILSDIAKPKKKITVEKIFEEYKDYKKSNVRLSSYNKSISILELRVIPYFKNISIDKLTKHILVDWKKKISESNLSIVTKQNTYREFTALLNYAVSVDYIPNNPLSAIGNFKDRYLEAEQQIRKVRYYTKEDFKKFITAARDYAKERDSLNAWGYYVFFNIAFFCGMRKGEINALKWSDINGDIISITRSVTQKLKGVSVFEGPPKNKSSIREIQIPVPLYEILKEHKVRQQKIKGFSEENRVCGGSDVLKDTSLENANILFAKTAGLSKIRIHDFRHSHASLLCNEGINIQEIARRLGHSNVQTTWNTYSHLYPRENERAISILNTIQI